MTRMKFDTLKFIKEIEKRPSIWSKDKRYQFADDNWKRIIQLYCPPDASSTTRRVIGTRLKMKWRNIRDAFVKSHKSKIHPDASSKKTWTYTYYNELKFLLDNKANLAGQSHEEHSNADDMYDDSDGANDDNFDVTEENSDTQGFAYAELLSDSNTATEHCEIKLERISNDDEPNLGEDSNPLSMRNLEDNGVTKQVELRLNGNIIADDDSALFFLSLVKDFKKVPESKQLQTKLNIMKLILESQKNKPS